MTHLCSCGTPLFAVVNSCKVQRDKQKSTYISISAIMLCAACALLFKLFMYYDIFSVVGIDLYITLAIRYIVRLYTVCSKFN